jgi:SWI/SNF-related matrix-associated actin-dependent regulator of chromatin subfamily A member 5
MIIFSSFFNVVFPSDLCSCLHCYSCYATDEMGLGKTLQTISFLGWLKYVAKIDGPFFIVVPLSVLSNWALEFKKFLPQMRVLKLHSADVEERERMKKEISNELLNNWDVVLTTYDMAKNPEMRHALISSVYWRVVVLDEGHIVRNENSIIAGVVRRMHYEHALLLTGTPLQNNLHELWSLLNFLHPDVFKSAERFDTCFNITDSKNCKVDRNTLMLVHDMLKPFMLRRIKAEVEKSVPPKVEKKILCPLTEIQAYWYKKFLLKDSSLLMQLELENEKAAAATTAASATTASNGATASASNGANGAASAASGGGGSVVAADGHGQGVSESVQKSRWRRLQMLFMQLRKVCNHPFLIEEADPNPTETDDSIVLASGKLQVLDRLLFKLAAAGHRVVIFSQFTSVLDILTDYLELRGYEYCRLDGQTNRVQRQVSINSFNAPNSPIFAFLLSTRAGGLGVNLQTADTVILYDSDWNPQQDLQAMARVHRIGQKKVVHVYRLIVQGTIEERMVQRAEKKLYLDQMVNRDGIKDQFKEAEEAGGGLGESDLMDMLQFGADEICNPCKENKISDSDIDQLINRCNGKLVGYGDAMSTSRQSVRNFNPAEAPKDTRDFQGHYYDKFGSATATGTAAGAGQSSRTSVVTSKSSTVVASASTGGGTGHYAKRTRVSRLETVTDDYGQRHQVLKSNQYTLGTGESSVFDRELKGADVAGMRAQQKRKQQIAGRDYDNEDHCLACGDGGDLLLCDRCPAAYHHACIGIDPKKGPTTNLTALSQWSCPHHRCTECNRNAAAGGGLLFRCSECPNAYCEDHLPEEAAIIGRCVRMEKGGFTLPRQACYVHCSDVCKHNALIEEQHEAGISDEYQSEEVEEEEAEEEEEEVYGWVGNGDGSHCGPSAHAGSMGRGGASGGAGESVASSSSSSSSETQVAAHAPSAQGSESPARKEASSSSSSSSSFVHMVESMAGDDCELGEAVRAAKLEVALLRHGLPAYLSEARCSECLSFHAGRSCALHFLGAGYRRSDPVMDQAFDEEMSMQDRKAIFLCQMDDWKEVAKRTTREFSVSLGGGGGQWSPSRGCNFRQKCFVYNFGEVLVSLIEDGALLLRESTRTISRTRVVSLSPVGESLIPMAHETKENIHNRIFKDRNAAIAELEKMILYSASKPGPQCDSRRNLSLPNWIMYHNGVPFSMTYTSFRKHIVQSDAYKEISGEHITQDVIDELIQKLVDSDRILISTEEVNSKTVIYLPVSAESMQAVLDRDAAILQELETLFVSQLSASGEAVSTSVFHEKMHRMITDPSYSFYEFMLGFFPQCELDMILSSGCVLPPTGMKTNIPSSYATFWLQVLSARLKEKGLIDTNAEYTRR